MCIRDSLSSWVDGVICDYNYVFDPNVKLKRFFGDGVSGDYIFLIDEAHNLAERGREMSVSYTHLDALLFLGGCLFICLAFRNNQEKPFRPTVSIALATIIFLVWGILSLSGISEFLYFNF